MTLKKFYPTGHRGFLTLPAHLVVKFKRRERQDYLITLEHLIKSLVEPELVEF
jgi:hypothetical protein